MNMPNTTPEQNKAIILEAFETLFNKRDYAAAERFWSPKYIQHSAHIAPGREGLFARVRSMPDKQRFDLGWRFPRSGSCHMHCGRVSGDGSVACARIGFQPWRGPADEFAVQTVASPSEHRQDRIHKNSCW
jgi:hypothetical protein